jgi:hypothetical protein
LKGSRLEIVVYLSDRVHTAMVMTTMMTIIPWWQDEGVLEDLPLLPPLPFALIAKSNQIEQVVFEPVLVCTPSTVPLPLPREVKEVAEEWTVVEGKKKHVNTNKEICRFVAEGKKCQHRDCRYAHKVDALEVHTCGYGEGCKKVKWKNGFYFNAPKCGRPCNYIHPGEEKDGLWKRLTK